MKWSDYQKGLYGYYKKRVDTPKDYESFLQEVKDYTRRKDKYIVYFGYANGKVVYVGTTIQHPYSRWYYHSTHGKPFEFKEEFRFDNEQDMLNKEYEMIQKYHPRHNKIVSRKQNFNVELTQEELDSRMDNPEWCQCCLKRRVNRGYRYCYYCSKI
jgi:hypothetical protein